MLALLIFGIAAVYLGFAVADGRTSAVVVESLIILGFLYLTLLGMNVSPWLLALAYFLHGMWDWLHRDGRVGAAVRDWYITACIVYDWLIAAFIVALLLT